MIKLTDKRFYEYSGDEDDIYQFECTNDMENIKWLIKDMEDFGIEPDDIVDNLLHNCVASCKGSKIKYAFYDEDDKFYIFKGNLEGVKEIILELDFCSCDIIDLILSSGVVSWS